MIILYVGRGAPTVKVWACALPGARCSVHSRAMAVGLTAAVLLVHHALVPSAFNLSNTLGDGMVLQRGNAAVVWGFGDSGETVTTTFRGAALSPPATVDSAGIWRQTLPTIQASTTPTTLLFKGSGGGSTQLKDVLVGDVFLCSGVRAPSLCLSVYLPPWLADCQ
eukprot:COSAG06_NODE_27528_length_591_cov_1.158537_1_plen_164_part_01